MRQPSPDAWPGPTQVSIQVVDVEKPNGDRLRIADIDCTDTSDGSGGCTSEGNISLFYADFFTSVSPNPARMFGLIDNVLVMSVPEPAAALLIACSAMALGARRRRIPGARS